MKKYRKNSLHKAFLQHNVLSSLFSLLSVIKVILFLLPPMYHTWKKKNPYQKADPASTPSATVNKTILTSNNLPLHMHKKYFQP